MLIPRSLSLKWVSTPRASHLTLRWYLLKRKFCVDNKKIENRPSISIGDFITYKQKHVLLTISKIFSIYWTNVTTKGRDICNDHASYCSKNSKLKRINALKWEKFNRRCCYSWWQTSFGEKCMSTLNPTGLRVQMVNCTSLISQV